LASVITWLPALRGSRPLLLQFDQRKDNKDEKILILSFFLVAAVLDAVKKIFVPICSEVCKESSSSFTLGWMNDAEIVAAIHNTHWSELHTPVRNKIISVDAYSFLDSDYSDQ
jgi:hypothetical protein